MTAGHPARPVPEGFEPHFRHSPLTDPWEPLFSRRERSRLCLGLRLAEPHCNARGMAHGGLISALADNAMGLACVLGSSGKAAGAVTASLTVDFVGAAQPGQWLQVAADPVRVGGTLGFGTAVITADGEIVARASGVFRMLASRED
jgi:uncharacterized protein (TIGR00369 family)